MSKEPTSIQIQPSESSTNAPATPSQVNTVSSQDSEPFLPTLETPRQFSTAATRLVTPIAAGRILAEPPSSPLTIPSTPSRPPGKQRASISEPEKVILVRTCIEYGDRFLSDTKKSFWSFIQALVGEQLGHPIGEPRQQVELLISKLEAREIMAKAASGTVIVDSDLMEAVREWKNNWVDRVRMMSFLYYHS